MARWCATPCSALPFFGDTLETSRGIQEVRCSRGPRHQDRRVPARTEQSEKTANHRNHHRSRQTIMKINDHTTPSLPSSRATLQTSHGCIHPLPSHNARHASWSCKCRMRGWMNPHRRHPMLVEPVPAPRPRAPRLRRHGMACKELSGPTSAHTRNAHSSDGGSPASRMAFRNPDRDTALASSSTRKSPATERIGCNYRILGVSLSFLPNVDVRPPARLKRS